MPSSILLNGERVYRPGVYVRVIDAIAPPTNFSAGNLAIVGDFPMLEKGKIHTFASSESFAELINPNGVTSFGASELRELREIGRIAFGQLIFETNGALDSLNLVNVRDSEAASYSNGGLTLQSKLRGSVGNSLRVELVAETSGYTAYVKQGTTILETFQNIAVEENPSIEFTNNGSDDLAAVTLEVSASSGGTLTEERSGGELRVRATRNFTVLQVQTAATAGTPLLTVDNGFGGGVLKFTSSTAVPTTSHVFTVTGLDNAGAEQTEIVTFAIGDAVGTTYTGTKNFAYIEKVEVTSPVSGVEIGVNINYPIKSAALTAINDVGNFLEQIEAIDDRFTIVSPPSPISADQLDQLAETSILSAEVELTTLLYRVWERAFSASLSLDAFMSSNEAPSAFSENLSGGGQGSNPVDDDWTDALSLLLYENINLVIPWSGTYAIHALFKQHCKDAERLAGLERCAWIGTPKDLSVNTAYLQYSKVLNDKNCAVVFQRLIVKNSIMNEATDCRWTALACAVLQGATPPATPLTRKRTTGLVNDLRNNTIEVSPASINEAIRKGLVIFSKNLVGNSFRIERSVTSFLTIPDHPVYTEVSANESVNVSIRDLRAYLQQVIGAKASPRLANEVKALVETRLAAQRENQIISNFRSVRVSLVGDLLNVSYELAAQEPLNFIVVTTTLQRF